VSALAEPQRRRPRRGAGLGTRLTLLNRFEIACDGAAVALPSGAQRLVAFLALQRRPALRGFVAGSLWPETSERRAHANLRSTLWRVQRSTGDLLDVRASQLSVDRRVIVDLDEAEVLAKGLLERSLGDPDDLPPHCLTVDVLPDWYDDWALLERERFRQLRLRALEALCDRLTTKGRFGDALELGLAALAGEPLRESAHRALIRIHLAEGNAGEALRQYELCRTLLAEKLGVEPSEHLESLLDGVTVRRRSGDDRVS
jgi:DNA-binding SARP family transcriptional activator